MRSFGEGTGLRCAGDGRAELDQHDVRNSPSLRPGGRRNVPAVGVGLPKARSMFGPRWRTCSATASS